MHLNAQSIQFLANLLAVEEWFAGPLPARLRNALAMRDLTDVAETTRTQRPNQLRTFGYLQHAERVLSGERGFRTWVSENGKNAVAISDTKTNLTEDEIEANIRAFGYEPLEGEKNAKRACPPSTPYVWASLDRTPEASPTSPDSDGPKPDGPANLTREQRELLEDLRAEFAKESEALDEAKRQAEAAGADIRPVRRRARFLEALLPRYEEAAARIDTGNPAAPGLAIEIVRVREELDDTNARLVGLNEGGLANLESQAAVLECVVSAILEAIAAINNPVAS